MAVAGLARRLSVLGLSAGAVALAVTGVRLERRAVAVDLGAARDLHGAGYAGSIACRRCHEDHYRSWHRTFHRTMTQDASAANAAAVLGDFSGAVYRYAGVEARMDRDAHGAFRMTFTSLDDPKQPPTTALISRAVGSRRYQQYLTAVGDREYRLPMAFHIEEKRWFPMNGAFLFADEGIKPGASEVPAFGGGAYDRHVTRWNDNCVFCHNVAPNPGLDRATGAFRTTVAEMGIACESCHGPGGEHARANRDPVRRYALHLGGAADPTIVNPSRLSPGRSADVCGRCHGQRITDDVGRFVEHGDPFVPGDDLGLYSAPLWQETAIAARGADDQRPFQDRFWADGTPRLTAYEYQGLLQSACAARGSLTCTSCHGMHDGDPRGQIRPSAAGDRACTGCHTALATAPAQARHSRHSVAGAGAACVDCHMPRIVYGVLDVHRSHRIEIPDPARDASFGRPDACTGCHVGRTPAWAASAARRLWGGRFQRVDAAAIATAVGPQGAVLAGDPIERAVAADALGRAPPPARDGAGSASRAARIGALLEAMDGDDYPAVRHLAWRALGRLLATGVGAAAAGASPPAPLASYDPTGPPKDRRAVIEAVRGALPSGSVSTPDPETARLLRARARQVAIEIGE
jgi:predicted CXXCH cytochrome family protein